MKKRGYVAHMGEINTLKFVGKPDGENTWKT
jgi:hypothetical protein